MRGAKIRFKDQFCKFLIGDKMYSFWQKHGILYKLDLEPIHSSCFGETSNDEKPLWHCRYGDLGYDNLKLLYEKSMVNGMNVSSNDQVDRNCEGCPNKSQSRSSQPLELIHSDVCGPMTVIQREVPDILLHSLMIIQGSKQSIS